VNTGFGKLSEITIDPEEQFKLQLNLVRSHSAGVGDPMGPGLVRATLFLKLLTYVKGYSGVRPEVVNKIIKLLDNDLLPVIPEKGSAGASGDLAPLAHMALAMIGEGEMIYKGRRISARNALKKANIAPLVLHPKEGLSLVNGTQVSTALAIRSMLDSDILLRTADAIGALSVEGSLSSGDVFRASIHQLKEHQGQRVTAKNVSNLLSGSEIVASHKKCGTVQDPYSFRCIPHIHGSCRDSVGHAGDVINNEINSVSDNPVIMDNGEVAYSGHFHAEPVAQALDIIAIAMAELGAISERRTYFFMKGVGDRIPPFLATKPGVESGYMMAQVTASALVSENKTLAHPASIDSLPTSGGQEDHVSMAPWAGLKLLQIQENVRQILAIELLVASAACTLFHDGLRPGKGTAPILEHIQRMVPFHKGDRVLSGEINTLSDLIGTGKVVSLVKEVIDLE
tara:strand:- start:1221 stop:2582 length:1362 start_codon:yes stop_codon:yes gene_type:complete